MIRVVIVDDHAIVRSGLRQFLSDHVDLRVTGEAADGREALELVRGGELDVLLLVAAVLPAFIIQMPDGRYRAVVEEPLTVESGGDREAALRVNLERYVAILERYVREFPEQWYCFYPFWDDPSRKEG